MAASGSSEPKRSSKGIRVLVVDRDARLRNALRRNLLRMGLDVLEASSPTEALLTLDRERVDMLLADTDTTGGDGGRTLLSSIHGRNQAPALIVMSGQSSVNEAVRFIRDGAFDYLEKPIDFDRLEELIPKALSESDTPSRRSSELDDVDILYSPSSPMVRVMAMVRRLAEYEAPVLLTGESGTGKEMVARALHRLSPRATGPMVAVNCAAIPSNLIESELFGHEKGSFTGAERKRSGRFGEADGGTLFLDEVGELSAEAQSKLLRVLQDGTYRPVGANRDLHSDARIVAATNRNLEEAVKTGAFREDLYYRLSVVPVHLPPLRERGSAEISLLAKHFIDSYNERYGTRVSSFTSRAWDALVHYAWPGNVRELEHLIQQQVILKGGGDIDVQSLPERMRQSDHSVDLQNQGPPDAVALGPLPEEGLHLQRTVEELTVHYLREALRRSEGNKTMAANLLCMKRTTFIEKLRRFQLL